MAQPAVIASLETWQHVGRRVADRRNARGLKQTELGSQAVISALENGRQASFARSTLTRASIALGWTANSIELMAQGEEPVEAERHVGRGERMLAAVTPATMSDVHRVDDRIEAMERRMASIEDALQQLLERSDDQVDDGERHLRSVADLGQVDADELRDIAERGKSRPSGSVPEEP